MRLLLDTHAFLWWILDSPRLTARARAAIGEPRNDVYFSTVSGWEIALKHAIGRLPLPEDPRRLIPRAVAASGLSVLPVELQHSLGILGLPEHHRDPFDRMLVSQALAEELVLVSADERIARYPVETLW